MRGVFFGVGSRVLERLLSQLLYLTTQVTYATKKQSEPVDNDKFGLFCVSNA